MFTRDHCDNCGCEFSEGRFVVGKLWCSECWSGRRPPEAMPCTPEQRRQLALWMAPKVPAKARTLSHSQAAQPGEVACG